MGGKVTNVGIWASTSYLTKNFDERGPVIWHPSVTSRKQNGRRNLQLLQISMQKKRSEKRKDN